MKIIMGCEMSDGIRPMLSCDRIVDRNEMCEITKYAPTRLSLELPPPSVKFYKNILLEV